MAKEHAWKTRAELADEVRRLESRTGATPGIDSLLRTPVRRADEYERCRRDLRRAYFAVADPAVRIRMIGLAVELQLRDRIEWNLTRQSARRDVEILDADRPVPGSLALGVLFALACAWIGHWLAGSAGETAGIALSVVCVATYFGRRRCRADSALAKAIARRASAEIRAREWDDAAMLFDSQEAATGVASGDSDATTARRPEGVPAPVVELVGRDVPWARAF